MIVVSGGIDVATRKEPGKNIYWYPKDKVVESIALFFVDASSELVAGVEWRIKTSQEVQL